MCLEVELSEIGNALASSVTRASDCASRARIARRVPFGHRTEQFIELLISIVTHKGEYRRRQEESQT